MPLALPLCWWCVLLCLVACLRQMVPESHDVSAAGLHICTSCSLPIHPLCCSDIDQLSSTSPSKEHPVDRRLYGQGFRLWSFSSLQTPLVAVCGQALVGAGNSARCRPLWSQSPVQAPVQPPLAPGMTMVTAACPRHCAACRFAAGSLAGGCTCCEECPSQSVLTCSSIWPFCLRPPQGAEQAS